MNALQHTVGHTTFWLGFAILAVGVSYLLRLLAARATRAGERRVEAARVTLGLPARAGARSERVNPASS